MGGFLYWWQHLPEHMSPILFHLGPLRVQWYGLMYIVAFATVYVLARYRMKREPRFAGVDDEFLKNILTYGFIGVLIGGRIGYVIFYNFHHYLAHPLEIIMPFSFEGGFHFTGISGMSYHGGITGCVIGCIIFCRKYRDAQGRPPDFWNLCDLFFPIAPLGYTFGRLGNFINGELYGRVTDAAIGMHFKDSPDPAVLRHPSQLYEAFFEGIVLFLVLYSLRKARLPKGSMAGLYLIGYGFVRFCIEFFRQPDVQLGFVLLDKFSMGQVLCFAMMAVGAGVVGYRWKAEGKKV
jgi:phosphatidylglycerol:prolipoprotein diacylglycerol transferase